MEPIIFNTGSGPFAAPRAIPPCILLGPEVALPESVLVHSLEEAHSALLGCGAGAYFEVARIAILDGLSHAGGSSVWLVPHPERARSSTPRWSLEVTLRSIANGIVARADWLRGELLAGGGGSLQVQEQEARHIAKLVERGEVWAPNGITVRNYERGRDDRRKREGGE